jgi:hypothetical protein
MIRSKRNWIGFALTASVVAAAVIGSAASAAPKQDSIEFDMVRSAAAEAGNCLADASADVHVTSKGTTETMKVDVEGLPPKTDFDFFVIQVPNKPFGLSWYQGDIETNGHGEGHEKFIGRFNIETFIVAPGTASAPVVHNDGPNPDADHNPATGPVHTYHLGLWFNSPDDAVNAGCPGDVTPFNGDHNAGIQVLSTRDRADDNGPLRDLTP